MSNTPIIRLDDPALNATPALCHRT